MAQVTSKLVWLALGLNILACVKKPSAHDKESQSVAMTSTNTATAIEEQSEPEPDVDPGEPAVVFRLADPTEATRAKIVDFAALTDPVKERGQDIVLRWAVIGSRAEIEQVGGPRIALFNAGDDVIFQSGQINVRPLKQLTYTLHVWSGKSEKESKLLKLKPSYPPFVNYFVASQYETYARGQAIDLRWEVDGATEVTLFDQNANMYYRVPGSLGGLKMQPEKTNLYTLNAVGPGGQAEAKLEVQVKAPLKITRFSAYPDIVKQQGDEVSLTWAVENAKRIDIIDQAAGRTYENVSQSVKVYPNQSTIYTLIAYGESSDNRQDIAVNIGIEPPRMNFTADPMSVTEPGAAVQLSWNVQHATKIYLREVETKVVHENLQPTATLVINPQRSGRYTLIANGKDGAIIEKSIDIVVRLPAMIETFTASTGATPLGGKVTLAWRVGEALRVELIDQTRGETTKIDKEGTLEVSPKLSTNYLLRAFGGDGASERGLMVQVLPTVPDIKLACLACVSDKPAKTEATIQWEVQNASQVELVSYSDPSAKTIQKVEAKGALTLPGSTSTTLFLKAYNHRHRAYYSRRITLERP